MSQIPLRERPLPTPRYGQSTPLALLALVLVALTTVAAAQDSLVGSFSDGRLTITIAGGGGQYSGEIALQGQSFPFTAQGSARRLDGSFRAGNDSFTFSATLLGDTLSLTSGGTNYSLSRRDTAPGPSGSSSERSIAPGTRVTHEVQVVSHPGTNAGPDARGSGGSGLDHFDVIHIDERMCVMVHSSYMYDLMGSGALSPSPSIGGTLVGRDGTCPDVWWPPERLAGYSAPPGAAEQHVTRGQFQLPGSDHTFNALHVSQELAETRFSSAWDLDSGYLLMFTDGTGARQAPAAGPTSSSVRTIVGVRQVELPWDAFAPLPQHLQQLQELTYSIEYTQDSAAVSFPGSAQTQRAEVRLTVSERHPTFLLLRDANASVGQDAVVVLAGNGSSFVPPHALATLQPGQLLDEDPLTRSRLSVEHVDASGVVLLEQGPTSRYRATYDPRSGLLITGLLEVNDGVSVTTIETRLLSQR